MGDAKRRIDQALVERGFVESRQRAQALLLAGQVLVNEQKVDKPGHLVKPDCLIRITRQLPFASRAGAKLQAALDEFRISVAGRICVDLGASTGGFTDCLLQAGAREVHAFDVGKGQLAWKLRSDPRVVVHDRVNVRNISFRDLPPQVSVVTVDLSFISLTKILSPLKEALRLQLQEPQKRSEVPVELVLLVKPQFEVGKGEVGKGGIVRDPARRRESLENVQEFAKKQGFSVVGSHPSPIAGSKGNQEFLLYLRLSPDLSSRHEPTSG